MPLQCGKEKAFFHRQMEKGLLSYFDNDARYPSTTPWGAFQRT